jgi:DNA processing protein
LRLPSFVLVLPEVGVGDGLAGCVFDAECLLKLADGPGHGETPRGRDFPRRNRLIAGLVLGVVLVEAARRSGSLITARRALDYGREVFAVPGSPLDPRAEGTNDLLKQGATLVSRAQDVVAALSPMIEQPPARPMEEPAAAMPHFAIAPPDGDARRSISTLLGPTPVAIDDLIRWSGAPTPVVLTALLELELAGRLTRQAGGRVALL